jgi:homeobox protein cut-like
LLQRATLAEKEVSALKEQLATANQNLQLVEGKGGGCNKPSGVDMEHNAMDIISRSGLEVELAAKEKEVSRNL